MTVSKTLTVKFNEVPASGTDYEFTSSRGELNEALRDILGFSPVYQVKLNLKPVETVVHLKGDISGELPHTCSRCAEDFRTPFSKSFITAYYRNEDTLNSLSEEVSDLEGSFDLEMLEGNTINLGEVVHEQIALDIPFQPVCSENCQGLCSQCGTNLNTEKCNCNRNVNIEVTKYSPFEKLKVLRGEL